MASDDQRTVIMSIHIAKGAIIAVVRRYDHEGLRQVQNSVPSWSKRRTTAIIAPFAM